MNAVAIGPLVFAPDRFAAILAIAAFLFLGEILSSKVDRRFSPWSWGAVVAFIVGARAGHVVMHAESFLAEPLRVFFLWQGGFLIPAGVGLALLYTLLHFRRALGLAPWTALPGAVAAYVAIFVLQLTAGVPATALPTAEMFQTLSGETFNAADLEGPLVINLWATWCPPCRREMPMMADIAKTTGDATFIFVNQGESAAMIEQFLASENLDLDHVVLDSFGEFGRHYDAPGLPATLFIDNEGHLGSVHMGEISREVLLSGIAQLRPQL
ncbi:MAG TPA: TlpA disulfide reductase family protein [Pelagibacterium sp.]|uniref:TlpA disulfide reductase family protein n=1 Tax=Pelagibacterium sp. TaxID=1967288 RepID=UPI002CC5A431|nr:TlpA disulfide reductase family protein [Pelagibacterium sp.]HWJ87710.1 TlpA disulfide reductase family protein [Pelagibacterium sp.]